MPFRCNTRSGFLFYFHKVNYLYFNDELLPADKPVLMADNKSFRYGDGLFETIKIIDQKIILEEYHFERLFASLQLMRFEIPGSFSKEKIIKQIQDLNKENGCSKSGRVRLSVYRGNGSINDTKNALDYIIECSRVDKSVNEFSEKGLVLGLYPDAKKSCDTFSNIKSANFLPYVMAARYARENNLDDSLVLNMHGRIADATIANVFLVNNKRIITPPLSEGCINGVMRRYLLEQLPKKKYEVEERSVTQQDIEKADELFLTNVMFGIKWVKQFNATSYAFSQTKEIYKQIIEPLWNIK